MLKRLLVENIATVEKQVIDFDSGLTVITGETGTGKSVLIKSLYLILGNKCPKDLIRSEASYLVVEATFLVDGNPEILKLLERMDIEFDGTLVIRRKIHRSGKNSIFINDYTSKISGLSNLGAHLIDLHGQHSQQLLLQSNMHVDYLDKFAANSDAVKQFSVAYRALLKKRTELEELEKDCNTRENKIDFIRFQLKEIEDSDLSIDEESELMEEFKLLNHGEQLISSLAPISNWSSAESSPINIIDDSLHALQNAVKIDSNLQKVVDEIQEGRIILEEAAADISRYLDRLELNPQRLDEVNLRLSELDKIKRKYGGSIDLVLQRQNELRNELSNLEQLETSSGSLTQEILSLTGALEKQSLKIRQKRESKKESFQRSILKHMEELGLEKSQFLIDISPLSSDGDKLAFGIKGADRVEFLLSTNPGQPVKPLAKIASGGELSRVMLAIKSTLNQDISCGTMIFDEVDTGISGRVADRVGIKLRNLGKSRQVICVSHSPQIAARGDTHLRVEKVIKKDTSYTIITPLIFEERVEEISRFISGNQLTETTRSAAEEMLKNAE